MPIGTTAALIGSAVLGAGSSAIAASKNSKAIQQSTDANLQAQRESIAAQQDAFNKSLAMQTGIYQNNAQTLAPYIQRGNAAGGAMNALLGLGGAQPMTAPQQQQPQYTQGMMTGQGAAPQGMDPQSQEWQTAYAASGGQITPDMWAGVYGQGGQQAPSGYEAQPGGGYMPYNTAQAPTATPSGQTAQQAASDAFGIFRDSTGYQFRLGEGNRQLNAGWAGRGMLQSGAAQKAAMEYGQNMASGEFGNYMGYLGNQQGVGLSGASAMAGVGQGYANNITNLNSNLAGAQSNYATNVGNTLSNAATARANNTNSMIGGIGGALSGALGGLAYSSYAPQAGGNPMIRY